MGGALLPGAPLRGGVHLPSVVEGGSFGLQFGGQAVDVIMLIMNDNGMTQLLSD
jgi:lipid-binding SYLF domain-containing protein